MTLEQSSFNSHVTSYLKIVCFLLNMLLVLFIVINNREWSDLIPGSTVHEEPDSKIHSILVAHNFFKSLLSESSPSPIFGPYKLVTIGEYITQITSFNCLLKHFHLFGGSDSSTSFFSLTNNFIEITKTELW